ncbi:hypothetical protein GCM10028818_55100 [Spirosoma horti]
MAFDQPDNASDPVEIGGRIGRHRVRVKYGSPRYGIRYTKAKCIRSQLTISNTLIYGIEQAVSLRY